MDQKAASTQEQLNELVEFIAKAVYGPKFDPNLPERLAAYDLPRLAPFLEDLTRIRNFQTSLAKGDLDVTLATRGFMAGTLKQLQSNLKHLSWQMERIANLDFTNNMQYLGEFAGTFNTMSNSLKTCLSEIEASKERYARLSAVDETTGLYNRRAFYERAEKELERCARRGREMSLLMLDLDYFKNINDTYGHSAGDEVLRAMGSLFMHMIRPEDTAARFGGEEFVLLFPEIDKQLACAIAERIRIAVEKNVLAYNDVALRVTVSIGVCVIDTASFARNHDSAILHTALNHADEALYFAKNSGRNRVALYSPEGLTLL